MKEENEGQKMSSKGGNESSTLDHSGNFTFQLKGTKIEEPDPQLARSTVFGHFFEQIGEQEFKESTPEPKVKLEASEITPQEQLRTSERSVDNTYADSQLGKRLAPQNNDSMEVEHYNQSQQRLLGALNGKASSRKKTDHIKSCNTIDMQVLKLLEKYKRNPISVLNELHIVNPTKGLLVDFTFEPIINSKTNHTEQFKCIATCSCLGKNTRITSTSLNKKQARVACAAKILCIVPSAVPELRSEVERVIKTKGIESEYIGLGGMDLRKMVTQEDEDCDDSLSANTTEEKKENLLSVAHSQEGLQRGGDLCVLERSFVDSHDFYSKLEGFQKKSKEYPSETVSGNAGDYIIFIRYGQITASGRGSNKQKARHEARTKLMQILSANTEFVKSILAHYQLPIPAELTTTNPSSKLVSNLSSTHKPMLEERIANPPSPQKALLVKREGRSSLEEIILAYSLDKKEKSLIDTVYERFVSLVTSRTKHFKPAFTIVGSYKLNTNRRRKQRIDLLLNFSYLIGLKKYSNPTLHIKNCLEEVVADSAKINEEQTVCRQPGEDSASKDSLQLSMGMFSENSQSGSCEASFTVVKYPDYKVRVFFKDFSIEGCGMNRMVAGFHHSVWLDQIIALMPGTDRFINICMLLRMWR